MTAPALCVQEELVIDDCLRLVRMSGVRSPPHCYRLLSRNARVDADECSAVNKVRSLYLPARDGVVRTTMSSVAGMARCSLLIASLTLACQQGASETSHAGPGGGGNGEGGAGELRAGSPSGGEPSFEPPPFLLYFSGFEAGRTVIGVRVDDRDVYWNLNGGRIMRGPKEGGEPELFLQCATCDRYNFATDEGLVYFLRGSEVLRVDRDSRQETVLPLDLDHLRRGALMVDETYVYTAMPGCAVLTRIHKQTLVKEIMQIDGVAFPGAGVTILDKAGERLVCAGPSDIFLINEWGQAERAYDGIDTLWAFAVAGEVGYWVEQPTANPPPVRLGRFAIFGGESAVVVQETQAGKTNRMAYAPAIDKLLYGTISALRAFDPQREALGTLVGLAAEGAEQLSGRASDVAVDDVAVYATVGGRVRQTIGGVETFPLAFWIAKVPLEQFR